jgi:hypothetical protein
MGLEIGKKRRWNRRWRKISCPFDDTGNTKLNWVHKTLSEKLGN